MVKEKKLIEEKEAKKEKDIYLTAGEFKELHNLKNENKNIEALFRKFTKEIRNYLP